MQTHRLRAGGEAVERELPVQQREYGVERGRGRRLGGVVAQQRDPRRPPVPAQRVRADDRPLDAARAPLVHLPGAVDEQVVADVVPAPLDLMERVDGGDAARHRRVVEHRALDPSVGGRAGGAGPPASHAERGTISTASLIRRLPPRGPRRDVDCGRGGPESRHPGDQDEDVDRCLAAVRAAADGPDEVIVVDAPRADGPARAQHRRAPRPPRRARVPRRRRARARRRVHPDPRGVRRRAVAHRRVRRLRRRAGRRPAWCRASATSCTTTSTTAAPAPPPPSGRAWARSGATRSCSPAATTPRRTRRRGSRTSSWGCASPSAAPGCA